MAETEYFVQYKSCTTETPHLSCSIYYIRYISAAVLDVCSCAELRQTQRPWWDGYRNRYQWHGGFRGSNSIQSSSPMSNRAAPVLTLLWWVYGSVLLLLLLNVCVRNPCFNNIQTLSHVSKVELDEFLVTDFAKTRNLVAIYKIPNKIQEGWRRTGPFKNYSGVLISHSDEENASAHLWSLSPVRLLNTIKYTEYNKNTMTTVKIEYIQWINTMNK